jgi:Zn-dependent protease
MQYASTEGVLYGVLIVILLFACVLLHELGHGWQARAFGLVVRRITLLPIGGLAQLETPPAYPWHELVIALAGPVVNLVLAVISGIAVFILNPLSFESFTPQNWLRQMLLLPFLSPGIAVIPLYLLVANLMLFVFNMVPAFPMDGGRILRSGLALVVDYQLATRLAAWLGRVIAIAMGVLGGIGWPPADIAPNPLLLLAALAVYFGAHQEEIYVRRRRALVRVEVGEVCQRPDDTLFPWDTVTPALASRLLKHDLTLPVVVDGRVVGVVSYHDVRRAGDFSPKKTVAHVMRADFPMLQPQDTLWVALQEMDTYQLTALPVVQEGVLHGMIGLDEVTHAWRFAPRRSRRADSTLASGDTIP